MSLVSQILDVKNNNCRTHCEGPYEHWGKSSKFQMIRCKSCKVVLFMEPKELKNLEISGPSGTAGGQSAQDISDENFADIYSYNDESEKLQDLNTYNFEPDDKILILEHKEKPFSPSMLNKNP